MPSPDTIFKLRATAFILLLLMLGIHGLKFFHSHEISFHHFYGQQSHEIINADPGEKSFHCSICDYQFTGNIQTGFVSLETALPLFKTLFVFFSESTFSAKHFTLTGRGPPSLLV